VKIIPILILSIFLISCSTTKPVAAITPKVVNLDSSVLEPCAILKEDIQILSFDQIIDLYGSLAAQYGICAIKQSNSIKLLKQFGNIE
jgi:hypothetical protein